MEENDVKILMIEKIIELNTLELNKMKILSAIFLKTSNDIIEKKVEALQTNLEEQAEYYGQYLEDYNDVCDGIIKKYKEQLLQIVENYKMYFINMQIELQEAECNQKIAITNLKKCLEIKEKLIENQSEEFIEEYNSKIDACMQKKINYDIIIKECENELNLCTSKMEQKINSLFADKSTQISLKEEGIFKKIINKLANIFSGAKKFNTYVIEPINVELEMMEDKLPDITNNIKNEAIYFVAKMKQAKDETNAIFEAMLKA